MYVFNLSLLLIFIRSVLHLNTLSCISFYPLVFWRKCKCCCLPLTDEDGSFRGAESLMEAAPSPQMRLWSVAVLFSDLINIQNIQIPHVSPEMLF